MPREVITIQVGQCGNQIGCRFWDLILREHASACKAPLFDAPLSCFFRNVDVRYAEPAELPVGDGRGEIRTLKARCILVDMEEGVVNSLLSGPLAELFDARQRITDVSGSGNNWAHGHHLYGPTYRGSIEEQLRQAAERCDSLQCFLLLHSLGGGTGSGFGSFLLESLEDLYPEVFRFVSCVCPARDDDVVTSPYNATLALRSLIRSAHCVLPASNDALISICGAIAARGAGAGEASLAGLPQDERRPPTTRPRGREAPRRGEGQPQRRTAHSAPPGRRPEPPPARTEQQPERPFDRMNSLVAHLLNNLTSSMRFDGSLNLDLNEITMNLVPFPRMHFLLSAMSPLCLGRDPRAAARGFHQAFADVLLHGHQLMNVDPRGSTHMAMAFLVRGSVSISDVHRNIAKLRKQVKMLPYNQDAFKVGLCSVPPKGLPFSVLGLTNSCATHLMFSQILRDFSRLYSRKAHVHHYTQYMEKELFDDAFETVNSLMKEYIQLEMLHQAPLAQEPVGSPCSASSVLFAPSAWATGEALQRQESLRHFLPQPLI